MIPRRRTGPGSLVLLSLIAVAASVLWVAPSAFAQDVNCNPPANTKEDWNVAGVAICNNRTITTRNLVVLWGAQVTLRNVTLIIDGDVDADAWQGQGIAVFGADDAHSAGGVLKVYDSVFRPLTPDKRALAAVGSGTTAHFVRTTFQNFRDIRGVEVTDFLMQDSKFIPEGRRAQGIITFNYPNYRFVGNFITNIEEIVAGRNVFENNTITNCAGALSVYNENIPVKVTHNTITGCYTGIGGPGCTNFAIHHNDIFDNGRNAAGAKYDAAICGDGRYNWWGRDPPLSEQFYGKPGETFNYTPWLTEPVHPERLPRPSVTGLPMSLSVNQTVTLDARASQPGTKFNFPLTSYEWDLGNGQTRSGATLTYAFPDQGTFNVTLRVVDSMGLSRSTTATVTVTNRPPTLEPITFEPNPPQAGRDLRSFVTATDPDGDTVRAESYRWSLNGSRVADLDNKTFIPAARVQNGQTWGLTVTVRDDVGATATREATISVPAPAGPSPTSEPTSPPTYAYTPPPEETYDWTPSPEPSRKPQEFNEPIPTPARNVSLNNLHDETKAPLAASPDAPKQASHVGLLLALASVVFVVAARRPR